MKKINIVLLIALLSIVASGCTSNKELLAPDSLYKNDRGMEIAYKSYNQSMGLWDIEYREDYVETDYGQTHIVIAGEDNKEALIILPGLFGDATMWFANVGELSKHYKIFALDMINYGGKSKPAGKAVTTFDDYKVWFEQILNHYELDSASVMGISYSSWLALSLSRESSSRISSLVLLDPSETFMPMNGGIAWKGFKYFMFFPNREKYAKFFDWLGGGYSNEKIDIWTEHMLDIIEYGAVKMFDVPQHRIYEPEELSMVKIPILIIVGGKPILYDNPGTLKEKAQQALPQAEVIIVPDAGHGINMEKPEFVNNEVIRFLEEN
jgi:pimeloyl-ACP methyl ester carboxylesterase